MDLLSKIKNLATKVFNKVKNYIYGEIENMSKAEEKKYETIENITEKVIDTTVSGVECVRRDVKTIFTNDVIAKKIGLFIIVSGIGIGVGIGGGLYLMSTIK